MSIASFDSQPFSPGIVVLFGSGETSPSGRKIFEHILKSLPPAAQVALLETPAGFELNSPLVAGRVAEFLKERLQNYRPQTEVIAARKRGTPFSPDNPEIVAPLLEAGLIFMGPGSPTYAVRQLKDSLAWQMMVARHRLGAPMVLASAAAIAISAYALPVYEIFKVGEDVHWKDGLDLLGPYGLPVVFIPHWNNEEGGANLDTSRCFMGRARFDPLEKMLPPGVSVVGIDEKTALQIDLAKGECTALGQGGVTIWCKGEECYFTHGKIFSISALGEFHMPAPEDGLLPEVWQQALAAHSRQQEGRQADPVPPEVLSLAQDRENARAQRDWPAADRLRNEIEALGWQVMDTPQGTQFERKE